MISHLLQLQAKLGINNPLNLPLLWGEYGGMSISLSDRQSSIEIPKCYIDMENALYDSIYHWLFTNDFYYHTS